MILRRLATLLAVAAAALSAAARRTEPPYRFDLPPGIAAPRVPADNPMTAAKVELGRRLFYDADLSADGTMSCATCHEQKRAFTDGNATHPGVGEAPGRRNPMGLANVGYFSPLTWADPARRRLEDQALTPLEGGHPVEMGMKGRRAELAQRLGADPCYRRMFQAAFPGHAGRTDEGDAIKAIAAFERTLLSFDSPYDRARRGAADALSPAARRGEALFFGPAGCASCHAGRDFTDLRLHRLAPADAAARDRGAFEITGRAADDGAFRTPSLRNVALTAPYLHDGQAASIEEAVRRHGPALASRIGGAAPAADLLAFLDSLTDRTFVSDPRFALPAAACGGRDADARSRRRPVEPTPAATSPRTSS